MKIGETVGCVTVLSFFPASPEILRHNANFPEDFRTTPEDFRYCRKISGFSGKILFKTYLLPIPHTINVSHAKRVEEKNMASEALEQMLGNELVPTIGQTRMYETIDIYVAGTTVLYTAGTFDAPKPFFETSTGFGVIVPTPLEIIDDYHETFKVDRYNNLYGGHSSITINKVKKRIDHLDNEW